MAATIEQSTISESVVGVRTVDPRRRARSRARVLLGADYYETEDMAPARRQRRRIGIGRNVVLDRVIVDKNARIGDGVRLVNEAGVQDADGDGYYIRNGIIIVPKEGIVADGTVV